MKISWMKLYFVGSLLFFAFLYGLVVGRYEIFPYKYIEEAKDAGFDLYKNWKDYTGVKPEKMLQPARHKGNGVVLSKPEEMQPGVTFITSMWDDTIGMNLLDEDGSVIHEWRVSFNKIWQEAPHLEKRITDWDSDVHGAHLYENGDVVFNYNQYGTVRIDKCSNVIWKLARTTHHSIYIDDDGNLWIPDYRDLAEASDRFPHMKPPIREELLLKVSPEGKILEEISILDVFYKSDQVALLMANGLNKALIEDAEDITHINDIDILSSSIANRFPMFEAGDIMVSMRSLNLVVVIDRKSLTIKWSQIGPFLRQHDPDFEPDGTISIFDNRTDYAKGELFGGSKILKVDPATHTTSVLYESMPDNAFYTEIAGKHHILENGNILIAEYDAGHAFEVTPDRKLVWSYINRYDDAEVYRVSEAVRLPLSYRTFTQETQSCAN